MSTRQQGARALAAGILCWAINLVLARTLGGYGPTLVLLGTLGVYAGVVGLLWGDSLRAMSLPQKIPALLIALGLVGGVALVLLRGGFPRH